MAGDLTLREAAAMLGCGRNRMSWLLRRGMVASRKAGRVWLVDLGDLLAKRAQWDLEGWPWRRM